MSGTTTWTVGQKVAGVGVVAVVVLIGAFSLRGVGRCGKLKRWYDYAVRMGGENDNEAVGLRIEAGNRGCEWAKQLEASREQDRYYKYYAKLHRVT